MVKLFSEVIVDEAKNLEVLFDIDKPKNITLVVDEPKNDEVDVDEPKNLEGDIIKVDGVIQLCMVGECNDIEC